MLNWVVYEKSFYDLGAVIFTKTLIWAFGLHTCHHIGFVSHWLNFIMYILVDELLYMGLHCLLILLVWGEWNHSLDVSSLSKGGHFYDYLLAFLYTKPFWEKMFGLNRENLLPREQILLLFEIIPVDQILQVFLFPLREKLVTI